MVTTVVEIRGRIGEMRRASMGVKKASQLSERTSRAGRGAYVGVVW